MAEPARPCPICGTAPDPRFRPFCSRRCADVDLHRWLTGAYRIATEEPAAEAAERADSADGTEWTGPADPARPEPARREPR